MQFPLELRLQPSRALMASVLVVHVAAALALFHVPALRVVFEVDEGTPGQRLAGVLAWVVLALSLVRALRAEGLKRGCSLWLEDDGLVEVFAEGAEQGVLCRVRPHSAVLLEWAVWFRLVTVESGANTLRGMLRMPSGMMLVASNLHANDWRLLRVWLRHRADRAPVVVDSPD